MKLSYDQTYAENLAYAHGKAELKWWIALLSGVLGGAFVAIGYLGAISIKAHLTSDTESVLATFVAGAIFPVGIIFCVFLGGGLFTSDALSVMALLEKRTHLYRIAINLPMTLIGNLLGAMIIALISWGANFFHDDDNGGTLKVLSQYVTVKSNLKWYAAFFSGVLCNLLVAGSIWACHATRNAGAKVVLLWLPITLFVVAGFEHIVANFFIFGSGLLHNKTAFTSTNHGIVCIKHIDMKVGTFIYRNLIPTTLGNLFAGGFLIPGPYYILHKFRRCKCNFKANEEE